VTAPYEWRPTWYEVPGGPPVEVWHAWLGDGDGPACGGAQPERTVDAFVHRYCCACIDELTRLGPS